MIVLKTIYKKIKMKKIVFTARICATDKDF